MVTAEGDKMRSAGRVKTLPTTRHEDTLWLRLAEVYSTEVSGPRNGREPGPPASRCPGHYRRGESKKEVVGLTADQVREPSAAIAR
jgi:hypothetical protein